MNNETKTILVIEDDLGLNELIRSEVESSRFNVISFYNGTDALEWLNESIPFLIILDFSLPEMTAIEFIAQLSEIRSEKIPFIISTGRGDERIAVDMMKLGARDYVIKDNNFIEMIKVVFDQTCADIDNERKLIETQEAFEALSQFNKQIIESAQEGIVVFDQDLKYKQWNPYMENLTGFAAVHVLGKSPSELVPSEIYDKLIPLLKNARNGAKPKEITYSVTYEVSKKSVWLSETVSPLRNEIGEITGVICIIRDITEQVKSREFLELSKQSYQDLINSITEALYIMDDSFSFIDVNKGAEKMNLSTKNELIGKIPIDFAAPGKNDIEKVTDILQSVQDTGLAKEFEFWGIRSNGELMPVDVIINKGRYFDKNVLIATARDITERKKSEQTLAKKVEELKFMNSFMVDRELKMIELKKDINKFLVELGREKEYDV